MHRIIGNERERGLKWAIPRLNATGDWDRASCLILEKDNDIAACVVYSRVYPKTSADISVASVGRNWLNRPFLSAVFRTPFLEWGVRRVGSNIAADNVKSIRFCEHLGFVREGAIREGAEPGIDLLIYGLLKSECRYLGEYSGEKGRRTAGAKSDCYGAGPDGL